MPFAIWRDIFEHLIINTMRNLKLTLSTFYLILFTYLNYGNAQSLITSTDKIEDHLSMYSYQHQDNLKVIDNKCKFYKRFKAVGTGLTAFGTVSLLAGIVRIRLSEFKFAFFNKTKPEDIHEESLFYIGVGMSAIGVICLGTGIPLSIVGKRKSKQYCNPKTNSLSLITTSKGLGLQLSF